MKKFNNCFTNEYGRNDCRRQRRALEVKIIRIRLKPERRTSHRFDPLTCKIHLPCLRNFNSSPTLEQTEMAGDLRRTQRQFLLSEEIRFNDGGCEKKRWKKFKIIFQWFFFFCVCFCFSPPPGGEFHHEKIEAEKFEVKNFQLIFSGHHFDGWRKS